MATKSVLPRVLAVIALAIPFSGCSDTTGPGVEPEIRNLVDSFEFQTSKLESYSKTLQYTWTNTGAVANINQSSSLSGGSVQLVIRDADGNEVYSRSLADNGTFVTAAGSPGTWSLSVVLSDATGTLNFRAEKKT